MSAASRRLNRSPTRSLNRGLNLLDGPSTSRVPKCELRPAGSTAWGLCDPREDQRQFASRKASEAMFISSALSLCRVRCVPCSPFGSILINAAEGPESPVTTYLPGDAPSSLFASQASAAELKPPSPQAVCFATVFPGRDLQRSAAWRNTIIIQVIAKTQPAAP